MKHKAGSIELSEYFEHKCLLGEKIQVKKREILFVIPSLAGGGAERILILLLKYLDRSRFKPVLVVFNTENAYKQDLPSDVPVVCLKKKNRFDFFRLVRSFSRIIRKEKPSLIFSFLTYTNYLTILARNLVDLRIPLLLSEHNNLNWSLKNQKFKRIKKILIRNLYPKATGIICVSRGVKENFITNYKIPENKCFVIYNMVDIERIKKLVNEEINHPWFKENIPVIITCGRLTVQKNYPLLLRAMSLALKKVNTRLLILGKGEDRSKLERYVKELGISHNVEFLGFQSNPFKYMSRATIFVLSSLWEGFGNVIIEAMACSVPVISTRCPFGPEEIITNGVNGLLVPVGDANALTNAILRLLKNESLRRRLAKAGRKRAEDFRVEKIVAEYERLFEEVGRP